MQWFYAKEGKTFGPIDESELFRLARAGELKGNDLVWNATMGDQWRPASSVPGLFGTPRPPVCKPSEFAQSGAAPHFPGATHNRELMRRARESLRGHWGIAVGGVLLYTVILSGVSAFFPCLGLIASLLITGPLVVGLNGLFLSLLRKRDAEIGQLFDGFKNFGTTCGAYLLMSLFIFLWSLLFIVPGIVASYRYAMTAYILADDPTVRAYEAIGRSAVMMRGRKWKLFCLYWRFFGWSLLCLLTCGIGYIWLAPYMQASVAHFYEDVRAGTAGNK